MKIWVTICFLFVTVMASAQTVTEVQRQKALDKGTRFCQLLADYSSGGEKYLTNDALIYDLCSSKNITAYDDLQGNCDDLLVSYLFTILQNYNNKLEMSFSSLKIDQVFGIPDVCRLKPDVNGNVFDLTMVGYSDRFIIMNTTQVMQSLGITTQRKLIYSCNDDKIIAFTQGDSPFIMYNTLFKAYVAGDFLAVYRLADKVRAVKRCDFHMKDDCARLALGAALKEKNLDMTEKYINCMRRDGSGYYEYIVGFINLAKQNLRESISLYEQAAEKGYYHAYYVLGFIYSMSDTGFQNFDKVNTYFRKGMEVDDDEISGFAAYWYFITCRSFPEELKVSEPQQLNLLKFAAEKKCVLAYLPLSALFEVLGDHASSIVWSELAGNNGSGVGLVRAGSYLLSLGEKYRADGLRYLQKALKTNIDAELKALKDETGLSFTFPRSSEDVRKLMRDYQ